MGNVFVISDLHFGHRNMALKRGFVSVEEHDAFIVEKWNSVVDKGDSVWILGDITMEKSEYQILGALKGFKKVVLGNHDQPQHVPELLKWVNSVCGAVRYRKCILTHIPVHPCEIGRFHRNIHGHVHENSVQNHPTLSDFFGDLDERYVNVSCEAINYTPVLISSLL